MENCLQYTVNQCTKFECKHYQNVNNLSNDSIINIIANLIMNQYLLP